MMNKKLILFALIAGLSASMWSCGSKSSSSSDTVETTAPASEEASTADEYSTAALLELGGSFTLADGLFSFSVPEGTIQAENSSYEYTFQLSDNPDSLVGITSASYMHQSAAGFGEGILADHISAGYNNVNGKAYTFGDIPAYTITAELNEVEVPLDYRMDFFQFGNGDLFCVNVTSPKGEMADHQSQIDTIISSIEYLGEPLKTEDEVVDNDRFTVTIGKDFYIRDKSDDENVYIGYNFNDNADEYVCRLELTVMDGMTPEEASETLYGQWQKNESASDFVKDTGECLGYDAYHISQVISYSGKTIDSESYHFEAGGTTYWLAITTERSLTEQFKKDIQPVLDSISFK